MCGIFGMAVSQATAWPITDMSALLRVLFRLSESRGKESAGLAIGSPLIGRAWLTKSAEPASVFLKSAAFDRLLNNLAGQFDSGSVRSVEVLAHARLVTNGDAAVEANNQPVQSGEVILVHNGIVVNAEDLWRSLSDRAREGEVDSEVIAALIDARMATDFDPVGACVAAFHQIEGSASIAWLHARMPALVLATNTGDIYYALLENGQRLVYASEQHILIEALRSRGQIELDSLVAHLEAGWGLLFDTQNGGARRFRLVDADMPLISIEQTPPWRVERIPSSQATSIRVPAFVRADDRLLRYRPERLRALRRCSRCVLPETFPFIEFDDRGVCNYCRNYVLKYDPVRLPEQRTKLLATLDTYRRTGGQPEVLVPLSGGRDSCYGLHLIKKEFGLRPITFTYDWGMVTDLARRNIARMCGRLGVENILVSADIAAKRRNIRLNVAAWLRQPDLGMVPLFMAGDKHFFRIVNILKRQTGIRLDLWSANPLENTDFKSGFCGVSPDFQKKRVDYLSLGRRLRLAGYYTSRFVTNPAYINRSLFDTALAFMAYYFEPRRDFFFLFHHLEWREDLVEEVILNEYDFERAPDSTSTWRIGDGTAPFYNYIYVTARGFSEFDTFRSNQIREGQLDRETALAKVIEENRPRLPSLKWYLDAIGLDFDSTIRRINQLDTLGLHT